MTFTLQLKKLTAYSTLALLVLSHNSFAQVYKTTDENGNPVFSDQASDGEAIDLKTTNIVPAVEPAERTQPTRDDNKQPSYSALSIASPANAAVIANGLSPFTVEVAISPALRPGHKLTVTIDGEIHSSGSATQFTVERIGRGTHTIQAHISDRGGRTLITSPSSSFFAYWPG